MPFLRPVAAAALVALGLLSAARPAHAHGARTFADLRTLGAAEVDEDSFTLAIDVDGPMAEVTSTQVLVNRGRSEHEVIYRYALPADAAVTGLAVRLGGKRHEGLVVDQAAAIAPLPDPEGAGGAPDTALLRRMAVDGDIAIYELRVYPVPGGQRVEVETTWVAPLRYDGGRLSLRVPSRGGTAHLAVPRVKLSARAPAGATSLGEVGGGGAVLAKDGGAAGRWSFAAPADDDLVIELAPRFPSSKPLVSVATAPLGEDRTLVGLAVLAPPPSAAEIPHYERVVFFVDTSRSLGADGLKSARTIVQSVLGSLPAEARVEAVLFDRKARRLWNGWGKNDRDGRKKLDAAIAEAPQDNGSDLGGALALARPILLDRTRDEAEAQRKGAAPPSTLVVLVSDGLAPVALSGDRAVDRYGEDLLDDAFVVSVTLYPRGGVAPAVDEPAAGVLAMRAGGRSLVVRDDEAPAQAARLAAELAQPAPLRALDLDVGTAVLDGLDLPGELAPGQGVVVLGAAFGTLPKKLVLRGRLGGEAIELPVAPAKGTLARTLRPMWLLRAGPAAFVSLAEREPGGGRGSYREDTWARAMRAYQREAQAAGVVTDDTALVVLRGDDALSRDRAAFARKWGPTRFQRFLPPPERIGDLAPEPPQPPPDVRAGATVATPRAFVPTGELDEKIVKRLMQTFVVPQARACFMRAARGEPTLTGAIDLVVEMARGEVTDVRIARSTFRTAEVDLCVIDAAYAIQVPRVGLGDERDSIVVARYPMTFRVKDAQAEISDEPRAPSAPKDPRQGGSPIAPDAPGAADPQ